ncbi:hypothetical protein SDC9_159728 [bioreactor metagenome]|uniref:Uncharacterized protein n=1 Tax=bioreactor metagenome TaxID=1076179 RepID=A0A645FEL2_9ZZZZ
MQRPDMQEYLFGVALNGRCLCQIGDLLKHHFPEAWQWRSLVTASRHMSAVVWDDAQTAPLYNDFPVSEFLS